MARYGHRACFLAVLLAATPVLAQQSASDDKLQLLERRLNDLTRQADEIRQELNRLKGNQPAPAPEPSTEDLTKVEVVPSAPAPAQQPLPTTVATSEQTPARETGPAALTDVQTINNVPNP